MNRRMMNFMVKRKRLSLTMTQHAVILGLFVYILIFGWELRAFAGEEVGSLLDLPPGPPLGRAIDALTEAQIRGQVRSARGAEKWLKDWANRDA